MFVSEKGGRGREADGYEGPHNVLFVLFWSSWRQ